MKRLALQLSVVLMMTSCAPVYVPNVRNAPLFRESGEFQGSVHIGLGVDAQAAFAITDHLGIMANYNWVDRSGSDDESDYVEHQLFEGGLGYYNNTGSICYEIYGGYGRGEGSGYDEYYFFGFGSLLATGRYNRYFLQPSIGSNHHIFNWTFTTRVSFVDFTEFETAGQQVYTDLDTEIFLEPSFTGRIFFGKSPVYGQFQAGINFPVGNSDFIEYEPFQMSMGLGVRLGGQRTGN